jgi:hypothetical protein
MTTWLLVETYWDIKCFHLLDLHFSVPLGGIAYFISSSVAVHLAVENVGRLLGSVLVQSLGVQVAEAHKDGDTSVLWIWTCSVTLHFLLTSTTNSQGGGNYLNESVLENKKELQNPDFNTNCS